MHGHRCTLFCSTKWAFPNTRTLKLWNTHICALDFYECSLWALENIKENGFDASFFVFFHFIGAPVFIVTLLRPSLPVAPCLKNVNKALKLLAFCRLCRAMAWQAVGLVRLSYVPHSKNGWALHENWLSNWKWKVMLKCTIMNGFCGPLLLPTSRQVLAPSNLLLHSLTVASRWRSSSSWRRTAAAGAAPMLERFEDARWWIPTPCWRPWCSA